MQTTGPSFRKSDRATRLTFEYEGESLRLISRHTMEKRTPPSDAMEGREKSREQSGFWFELRDREGRALYRRVLHNPMQMSAEVLSDNPERSFERHPISNPRGTFFLLIPDLPEAQTVSIWSSPMEPEAALKAAREIASFSLRDDRNNAKRNATNSNATNVPKDDDSQPTNNNQ